MHLGFFCKLTENFRYLFCSHGESLELNEEKKSVEETESYLALNACPRGGGQSAIFCVMSRIDCFFLRLDVYSWDQFVLSWREWLMKELLKLLSDVFCESL